jgi:hypothetical protein
MEEYLVIPYLYRKSIDILHQQYCLTRKFLWRVVANAGLHLVRPQMQQYVLMAILPLGFRPIYAPSID